MLAIVCRPDETGFFDPRFTPGAMLEALKDRPEITLDFCRHGTTLPHEAGIGALCFEAADEALHLVRATEFGDLMSRFDIPLVVLEACRTATKALVRETVAGALLKQGVGSVLPAFQSEPSPHRPRVGGSMTGSYSDEQPENQASDQTSATTAPEPVASVAADH